MCSLKIQPPRVFNHDELGHFGPYKNMQRGKRPLLIDAPKQGQTNRQTNSDLRASIPLYRQW